MANFLLLAVNFGQWIVARQSLEDVQRAFVFAYDPRIGLPSPNSEVQDAFVVVSIENSGNTSANSLEVNVNRWLTRLDKLPDDFDFPDSKLSNSRGMVAPKAQTSGPMVPIPLNCLNLVKQGKLKLYVWGRLNYVDVFRYSHETDFCWRWTGSFTPNVPPGVTGDIFTTCPEHNCADADCKNWITNRRVEQITDKICDEIK